ncbi:hypothetical protein C8J57DRAFT_1357420, partial [Mycena rebaudengoi]
MMSLLCVPFSIHCFFIFCAFFSLPPVSRFLRSLSSGRRVAFPHSKFSPSLWCFFPQLVCALHFLTGPLYSVLPILYLVLLCFPFCVSLVAGSLFLAPWALFASRPELV